MLGFRNRRKGVLAVSLLILLNACAPQREAIRPVEVKVPVIVDCAPEINEPDWYIPRLAKTSSESDKLKALLADYALSKGYIEELKGALAACL